jgi:hypothetical protein
VSFIVKVKGHFEKYVAAQAADFGLLGEILDLENSNESIKFTALKFMNYFISKHKWQETSEILYNKSIYIRSWCKPALLYPPIRIRHLGFSHQKK